jgi:myosin heavy subunit
MSPSVSSRSSHTSSASTSHRTKKQQNNKAAKSKMAPGRGFELLHTGLSAKEYVWCDANQTGNQEAVWTRAQALAQSGPLLTVRTENSRSVLQLDLRQTLVFPANAPGANSEQITSLRHINEPCILDNLEQRAEAGEPYTFLGGVLVYVNPLVWGKEEAGMLGSSDIVGRPHPYAVAEAAFQHMSYHADKALTTSATIVQHQRSARAQGRRGRQAARDASQRVLSQDEMANQSIVTSGESGSGKTECTKMLLRQLMARSGSNDDGQTKTAEGNGRAAGMELEKLVMESNVLTEALGNATTLRNANSSRYVLLLVGRATTDGSTLRFATKLLDLVVMRTCPLATSTQLNQQQCVSCRSSKQS